MSERNVELMRQTTDAWNSRDIEAFVAYCDESIEWHSTFAAVGGAVYHGHDGLRRYQRDMEDAWGDEIRLEPEAYFDLGEHTLGFYVVHGRGQHSGVDVAMPNAAVFTWRDGLLVHMKAYVHREDALSDLGVAEDELERIEP
jgi:ketosteroid isomerase-like protein